MGQQSIKQRVRTASSNTLDGILHRELNIALDQYAESYKSINPEVKEFKFELNVYKLNAPGTVEVQSEQGSILAEAMIALDCIEDGVRSRLIANKVGFASLHHMRKEDEWKAVLYRSLLKNLVGAFHMLSDLKKQATDAK